MLNFWENIENLFERTFQDITDWDRSLKTDWYQPEIAPIKKNRERFVPVSFRSCAHKNKYNIKQPVSRTGYRRGQRREYDKV